MGAGFSIKAKANKTAEILIYEDVGEGWFGGVSAKQFALELKALGDVTTIDVRINSYGGDVFEGLAIYNQLVRHKAKIITHVDGIAASIASVIAMAGNEIRIGESGWLMIHNAWSMAAGDYHAMDEMSARLRATSKTLADIYVARTGADLAKVKAWMDEETWFDASQATAEKFADSVTENLRMAARLVPDRFAFRHVPAAIQQAAMTRADAEPHPANADIRAQLAALTERARARHITPPTP
ncbi:MAG: head maturation protease, ClpP-related [Roseateles sp.]|uniref:head maturation protease, ClpP-related n=1 Tax=Roseateles sp. TaxID=1971397 RepID=UPI0040365135